MIALRKRFFKKGNWFSPTFNFIYKKVCFLIGSDWEAG